MVSSRLRWTPTKLCLENDWCQVGFICLTSQQTSLLGDRTLDLPLYPDRVLFLVNLRRDIFVHIESHFVFCQCQSNSL